MKEKTEERKNEWTTKRQRKQHINEKQQMNEHETCERNNIDEQQTNIWMKTKQMNEKQNR